MAVEANPENLKSGMMSSTADSDAAVSQKPAPEQEVIKNGNASGDNFLSNDPRSLTDKNTAKHIDQPSAPKLEVDPEEDLDNDDTDSTMEESKLNSTESLRESVTQYVEENGRTYHSYKAGIYILPNDHYEQERLDLQNTLFALSFDGKLHLAPLPDALHNVMDIGAGTGLWATQFAKQYPSTKVLGTDLSPIQPTNAPLNCTFEVSDAEEPWNYPQKFNYIHGRALLSCFSSPSNVIRSAYENLLPGGYLELQDPQLPIFGDATLDGSAVGKWGHLCIESGRKRGRHLDNSRNYGRFMEEVGFVDIVEKHFYWPLNGWAKGKKEKLLGRWMQQNLMIGLEGMTKRNFTMGLGWSAERVDDFLVEVKRDIRDKRIHSFVDVVVFYGRKPELMEV